MDKAASTGHSDRCRIVVVTCCDFSPEVAANLDVDILGFPFIIDGEERTDDIWSSMSPKEFYDRMRAGARVLYRVCQGGHAHGLPVLYLGAVVELQLRVPGGGRRARRVSRF